MFLRLSSGLLPDYASLIEFALDESLPKNENSTKNLIYQDLLLDYADCWVSYQLIEGVTTLKAIAITKITDSIATGSRVLTIIATYGFEKLGPEDFKEAFDTVRKFAEAHDCHKMDFYTDNPRIIEYGRMFKIDRECTYLQLSFVQSLNEEEV